jgi:hypothetical protein
MADPNPKSQCIAPTAPESGAEDRTSPAAVIHLVPDLPVTDEANVVAISEVI